MASFQLRGDFLASSTAAATTFAAWSAVIAGPYGTSNGIWSGTAAGAAGAGAGAGAGACADACPATASAAQVANKVITKLRMSIPSQRVHCRPHDGPAFSRGARIELCGDSRNRLAPEGRADGM